MLSPVATSRYRNFLPLKLFPNVDGCRWTTVDTWAPSLFGIVHRSVWTIYIYICRPRTHLISFLGCWPLVDLHFMGQIFPNVSHLGSRYNDVLDKSTLRKSIHIWTWFIFSWWINMYIKQRSCFLKKGTISKSHESSLTYHFLGHKYVKKKTVPHSTQNDVCQHYHHLAWWFQPIKNIFINTGLFSQWSGWT